MKHWYYFWGAFTTFSNFYAIYLAKMTSRTPVLRTWSGTLFPVQNLNSNFGTILEVWHDRVYGNLASIVEMKDPVVIDIGANIGAFTFFVLKKNKGAHVYAYEPDAGNFRVLTDGIAANRFAEHVSAYNIAVASDTKGRILSLVGDSSGRNSTVNAVGARTVTVPSTTLEHIFTDNNIVRCDLLKVDCEGAEYEIFESVPSALFERIHHIVLEWHVVSGHAPESLRYLLEQYGYHVEQSPHASNTWIARRKGE